MNVGKFNITLAQLEYSCSGNYLQNFKAIGNVTLLMTSNICFKVSMAKNGQCVFMAYM